MMLGRTHLVLSRELGVLVDIDGHEVVPGLWAGLALEERGEDAARLAPAVALETASELGKQDG